MLGKKTEVKQPLKNIAWVPCNPEFSKNRMFDLSAARDNAIERFVESCGLLTRKGFVCNTIDLCDQKSIDVVIFYGISSELRWLIQTVKSNPGVKLINIPIEPPVVAPMHDELILSSMPFDRILVWNDDLAEKGDPFVKANIGEAVIHAELIPSVSFHAKKFLCAICSSKLILHKNGIYEERFRAFEFFSSKPEGMDLFGVGWEGSTLPFVKASYRGICATKMDVLRNYKFSICFENAKGYPGLITEKIFDCFAAGTVPIYYGAPNVQDYIPKECFIDFQEFRSYEELYQLLTTMTEVEYQSYLDAVKAFIATPEYYEFTSKRYAEVVLEQIQSVMNESKLNRTVLDFKWPLFRIAFSHPVLFLKNLKKCRRFLFDLLMVW